MRTHRVALAVAAAALLGACTPQSPATAVATPAAGMDSAYLAAVHAQGVQTDDGELLDVAHDVCGFIDQGGTLIGMVIYVKQRLGVDTQPAAFVVGAGVKSQCPDRYARLSGQG